MVEVEEDDGESSRSAGVEASRVSGLDTGHLITLRATKQTVPASIGSEGRAPPTDQEPSNWIA